MKQTRMSLEQYVKVTDWLRLNKTGIEGTEMTQSEVAMRLEQDLGFKVPVTTAQRCARIAKIKWVNSPKVVKDLSHEDIVVLLAAVTDLFVILDQKMPDRLAELKARYVHA